MTIDLCASFEIAIERVAHGASSPEEGAALAEHLASCDACRRYADSTALAARGMVTLAERARAEVDWTGMERQIRRAAARRLRRFFVMMGVGILSALACIVGFGADASVDVSVVLVVATILAVRLVTVLSESRTLSLVHGEDLFAAHRASLATRIRSLMGLRWVALGVIALLVGLAVLSPDILLRARLTYGALAMIVGAVWGHNVLVELPRLGRELRSLESK